MSMIVKLHYNHNFYLIKESDDGSDGVESSMNHTQHKSLRKTTAC
jgi:hypothetical protein